MQPTLTPTPNVNGPYVGPEREIGALRLKDNLDDPKGYCLDVPGFGDSIRLDAPLQAHTCKTGADDQVFSFEVPTAQYQDRVKTKLFLDGYDRCLSVDPVSASGKWNLITADCEGEKPWDTRQDFLTTPDGWLLTRRAGRLTPREPYLYCIGVADGVGEPAGGRNHLRRDLMLYYCDSADPALITWELSVADSLN